VTLGRGRDTARSSRRTKPPVLRARDSPSVAPHAYRRVRVQRPPGPAGVPRMRSTKTPIGEPASGGLSTTAGTCFALVPSRPVTRAARCRDLVSKDLNMAGDVYPCIRGILVQESALARPTGMRRGVSGRADGRGHSTSVSRLLSRVAKTFLRGQQTDHRGADVERVMDSSLSQGRGRARCAGATVVAYLAVAGTAGKKSRRGNR
jgi:hypothetical protein